MPSIFSSDLFWVVYLFLYITFCILCGETLLCPTDFICVYPDARTREGENFLHIPHILAYVLLLVFKVLSEYWISDPDIIDCA